MTEHFPEEQGGLEVAEVRAEIRQIGERVFQVSHLPAEDPETVRQRDGIAPEHIGGKPMATVHTATGLDIDGEAVGYIGRVAPRLGPDGKQR